MRQKHKQKKLLFSWSPTDAQYVLGRAGRRWTPWSHHRAPCLSAASQQHNSAVRPAVSGIASAVLHRRDATTAPLSRYAERRLYYHIIISYDRDVRDKTTIHCRRTIRFIFSRSPSPSLCPRFFCAESRFVPIYIKYTSYRIILPKNISSVNFSIWIFISYFIRFPTSPPKNATVRQEGRVKKDEKGRRKVAVHWRQVRR